jgi:hypothetical protein
MQYWEVTHILPPQYWGFDSFPSIFVIAINQMYPTQIEKSINLQRYNPCLRDKGGDAP